MSEVLLSCRISICLIKRRSSYGNVYNEKPRSYHHEYIYVDERKEKLQKIEETAKRELGMLPPKEFSPEDIRGKFVESTTYLKRRKESGRKPLTYATLFVAIAVLAYILHYLVTGEFTF